jgi:ATP-dependent Clp protease ATP-binding subunit ClpC
MIAELGYDPEIGARPLRRVIQNKVEDHLSDALLSEEFKSGEHILIDVHEGELVFRSGTQEEDSEEQVEVALG